MYKLEKILFNCLGKAHIPYCLGGIVIGPKGGTYFLDLFNLERLVRKALGYNVLFPYTINELATRGNIKETVCINYSSEEELMRKIREEYKYTTLVRLDGIKTTDKIAENIQIL